MKKLIPENSILVPDEAELKFRGSIFDVYQWPQKMFDGSIKTFELMRRADTVQIIAVKDDKLVMVKDEQPDRPAQEYPPRGRVDPNDASWLEAAKREMLEETGMQFRDWRLVEVSQPAAKLEWFVATYLATDFVSQGAQKLDKGGERISVWLESFDNVRDMSLSNHSISYLKPFFANISNIEELLALKEFEGVMVDR
jgi:ADP-ribose pyrophosphatase